MQSFLWKVPPKADSWLPAYAVFGEGLFFELKPDFLSSWRNGRVNTRIARLQTSHNRAQQHRKAEPEKISPVLVLLHTLAHVLMNRLTFECGYSSAALRERLYVSDDPGSPMAGASYLYGCRRRRRNPWWLGKGRGSRTAGAYPSESS